MADLIIQYDHLMSPRGESFQGFWIKDRTTHRPIHEKPFVDQMSASNALRGMARYPLTAEQLAYRIFDSTWQAVAGDVFRSDDRHRKAYRRSEVFDMCFDHLNLACESCSGITLDQVRAIQTYFIALPKARQQKFIKVALPYTHYVD